MESYVYLGHGYRDHTHLMKIGKANNVRRREKQLKGVVLEYCVSCSSQNVAHEYEDKARCYIVDLGANQYKRTRDWFYFDYFIYIQAKHYLMTFNGHFEIKYFRQDQISKMIEIQQHIFDFSPDTRMKETAQKIINLLYMHRYQMDTIEDLMQSNQELKLKNSNMRNRLPCATRLPAGSTPC